jgi:hypothetical protein
MRELQQDSGYQSRRKQANRPPIPVRPSRNFYISVNNSQNNRRRPQNNTLNNRRRPHNNTLNNQHRPQRGFANSQTGGIVASREQQARWLREYKLQQRGGSIIRGGTEARQKKQISWVKRQFGGGDMRAAGKKTDNLKSWMSKI